MAVAHRGRRPFEGPLRPPAIAPVMVFLVPSGADDENLRAFRLQSRGSPREAANGSALAWLPFMNVRAATVAALVSVAVAVVPRPADACSCAPNPTTLVAPAPDSAEVPVNARVWIIASPNYFSSDAEPVSTDSWALQEAGGEQVAATTFLIPITEGRALIVLRPAADLKAGMSYEVVGSNAVLGTFRTGSHADTEAPRVPAAAVTSAHSEPPMTAGRSSCGDSYFLGFTVTHDGAVALANYGNDEGFNAETLTGSVDHATPGDRMNFGRMACSTTWVDARPGATLTVRFASFDVAGNFSGWSTPQVETIPWATLSCSTTSSEPTLLAVTLLASLFALRRRRHADARNRP